MTTTASCAGQEGLFSESSPRTLPRLTAPAVKKTEGGSPPHQKKGTLQGFVKLLCGVLTIWIFIAYLAPAMIAAIPAWRTLAAAQDINGISASAIYYTDVEANSAAELHTRHTILHPPRSMPSAP